ncbi:MAG TPA: hypothetical protein VF178_08465 [Gemmatimonadaceae bacterium]
MAGPLAYHPGEGIPIDSPLTYAAVLEERGHEMFGDAPGNDEIAASLAEPHPGVPLAVHRYEGGWIYCASLGEVEGRHGAQRLHWNKRFDDMLAQRAIEAGGIELGRRSKVNLGAGEFRAYHMPLYLEHVERLVWHAIGEPGEVLRLLQTHVTHLGKKRAAGHGAVAAWDVEPWSGPADRWLWREPGVPARAIPLRMLGSWEGETAAAGARPPYWLAAHQVLCAVGS